MWKTVTMWKMLKTQNKLKSSSETEMMLGVPTTTSSSLLDQGKTILKCLCVEVTPLIHRVQVFSRHCMHWSIWHQVKKQVWEIKQFLIAGFTKRWVALLRSWRNTGWLCSCPVLHINRFVSAIQPSHEKQSKCTQMSENKAQRQSKIL